MTVRSSIEYLGLHPIISEYDLSVRPPGKPNQEARILVLLFLKAQKYKSDCGRQNMKNDRLVELAIEGLQEAKRRIDAELTELLGLVGVQVTTNALAAKPSKKPVRKKRTAAQKKAHSERMKKIWAERKKGKK